MRASRARVEAAAKATWWANFERPHPLSKAMQRERQTLMRKVLMLPLIVFLCGSTFGTASSTPPARPAAKECSDCGCAGPDGKGACPDEKGKTCHCGKK